MKQTHQIIVATNKKVTYDTTQYIRQPQKVVAIKSVDEFDDTPKIKKVTSIQSKRIKDYRIKHNLTQHDFAKLVEIKPNVIAEYENGTAIFNVIEWNKINKQLSKC